MNNKKTIFRKRITEEDSVSENSNKDNKFEKLILSKKLFLNSTKLKKNVTKKVSSLILILLTKYN